jgi:nucleoside-diphosphate-sugar epimerase
VAPKHTVLVTGAGGFIGSALVGRFLSHGWKAIGCGRERTPDFPSEAQWRPYDLAWPSLSDSLFDGVDVLVHAAVVRNDFDVNVAGSTLLLERALACGVKQIVFLSSLAAHDGALSQYGKQKLVLERLFNERGALVIRPGLVVGDGGTFGAIVAYLKKHRFVPLIGGGVQPLQTVDVAVLTEKIYEAVERDARGVFTVAGDPVSYRAFYETLCSRLGVRCTFVPVPFWAADLAVRLAASMHVDLPIDRDNLLGLRAMRVDASPQL